MKRKGSYIAGEIMRDYKQRKAYKKKQRANCKDKQCNECKYERICIESVRKDEIQM